MPTALAEAKQRLAFNFDNSAPPTFEPILADPWVISSLLQKSIRRGEVEIAQRAAHTLFKLKGSAIWRRLMVIAFEDIGIGSPHALVMTVAAGSDPVWRKQLGGDAHVVSTLARLMAEAAKDRSSDYLVGAGDHPSLVDVAKTMAKSSIEVRLAVVSDPQLFLRHRVVAARSIWGTTDAPNKSNLAALFAAFRSLGVPEELVVATEIAAVRTREPITVMVPLIWLAANTGQIPSIRDCPVPPSPVVGNNLAYHGARAEKPGFNVMLTRDLDPEAGAVELYPQEITRALLNLISNGFYAATQRKSAEGETFEPVLIAATKNLGKTVEIRIRDNGTGIPDEVKEKIFNPFFTTKPSGEGTGLGLSMSHDIIVKQHGGSIDVETEPGLFTEFKIVLPRTSQR